MNLGELGEILGILFFYLYPGKEAESFITTHYRRYATWLFPYVLFDLVQCSNTRARINRGNGGLGVKMVVNLLCLSSMGDKTENARGKDTFLVRTRPSLSASVSPSAVSAAKPRILWCSCCFGHPSYHSAMSAINNCPRNGTDIDLIRKKSGLHLYTILMDMKCGLCVFVLWILISSAFENRTILRICITIFIMPV